MTEWANKTARLEPDSRPSRLEAGSVIAGYELQKPLGHGGMAVVWLARDMQLDRQVALKILAPSLTADDQYRLRFITESRAASAIDDPHIIPVYQAGEADGVLYIAMRYARGGDVGTLCRKQGPLPLARVGAILSPIASALDAAHDEGLIHRDVKPANMLIDARPRRPNHVYLADFGLSLRSVSAQRLTMAGFVMGTPDYCAPEQINGGSVTGQTDQYALACSTMEMLTGAPPFPRDDSQAILYAHLLEAPPLLTARRQGMPRGADRVLAKAMSKTARDRFASCQDFAEELRLALGLTPYLPDGPADQGSGDQGTPGRAAAGQDARTRDAADRTAADRDAADRDAADRTAADRTAADRDAPTRDAADRAAAGQDARTRDAADRAAAGQDARTRDAADRAAADGDAPGRPGGRGRHRAPAPSQRPTELATAPMPADSGLLPGTAPTVADPAPELPLAPPGKLHSEITPDAVVLTWEAPSEAANLTYKVVRLTTAPDGNQADFRVLGTTVATEIEDAGVPGGVLVAHEVTAVSGRQASAAARSAPTLMSRDITNLSAHADTTGVTLSWSLPIRFGKVVVVREADPHAALTMAPRRIVVEGSRWTDVSPAHGVAFIYHVFAEYRDARGTEVRTTGAKVRAMVTAPPRPRQGR